PSTAGYEKVSKVFRILKANIQLLFKRSKKSQVILITSPEKNDGKTTISANLGVSFEFGTNSKVIIVDLNFEEPKLHKYFRNISNETGILDIFKRYSYTDKELEKLIEKNALEKEVLKSTFAILEKEKNKEDAPFILDEVEGILDTIIRKNFKTGSSIDEIVKNINKEIKNLIESDIKLQNSKLYIKLTNAVNTAVKRFSKEKVISAEKEKIFKAQIKYSIKKVPEFENLYIITAGTIEKEDVYLSKNLIFTSNILKNIIKELKKDFKYIILNTSPIYSVPEVFMLMEESDISLIVFRVDKTKKQSIKDIDRKLSEIGIENVGIVINDVKEKLTNGVME
ncbi:MAG: CpsD/CapB family tyrosine-protein kinase, partial [Aquificae bacterium]|nr:CpsD/CapB family tyrosine-protein kinase [Aquificota bacterium]